MTAEDRPGAPASSLTDHAAYAAPTRHCDIVMKGGVTSGIVYPLAICELATTYRFRNIGGTSAGAIAAAAAAAAEHGRHAPGGGFAAIAALPAWLGGGATLRSLFQPDRSTRPLFHLLLALLDLRRGRWHRLVGAALRWFPVAALLGALPGLILALAVAPVAGFARVWGLLAALLLLLLGTTVAVLIRAVMLGLRAMPANGFGLCSGMSADAASGVPALTVWLTDLLDRLAGKTAAEGPLTFGDLWGSPAGAEDPARRAINLEMMTTCLTQGRPYRLPFETDGFYFHPEEFRRLFPARVVDWLLAHPRPGAPRDRHVPLRPLPAAADLPVVVATRLSLSFPLLMSAVPLHAIDFNRNLPRQARAPERCWFSDGGITSNLPVHFFDSPLPRWPTFAINLRGVHPDYPLSADESANVYLPTRNRQGILAWWSRFDETSLAGFLGAILSTMQNWQDNAHLPLPGYRDRIAHISLAEHEGGLNLTMDRDTISRLSERGRWAGVKLRRQFAEPATDPWATSWDNHRWVRYRSTMAMLEVFLDRLHRGYTYQEAGERSYAELIERPEEEPPRSYRWWPARQRAFAIGATRDVVALAEEWAARDRGFAAGAPRPRPELRIRPRV